jgi:hypothetical protein
VTDSTSGTAAHIACHDRDYRFINEKMSNIGDAWRVPLG